jgi:hypothetical protein
MNMTPSISAASVFPHADVLQAGPAGPGNPAAARGSAPISGSSECQTCRNRKYVDRSGDSTVSFQSPTKVATGSAYTMVRAHEQEHVAHEQAAAREEGLTVVSQTVSIHTAICPECGRSYVSGGTTTTSTRQDSRARRYDPSAKAATGRSGGTVDLRV